MNVRNIDGSLNKEGVKIIDDRLYFYFLNLFFFFFFILFSFHFSIFRTTRVRVDQVCCHISHNLMA